MQTISTTAQRHARVVFFLVSLAVLSAIADVRAQPSASSAITSPDQEAISRLVHQLGAEDSELRTEAHQKLITLRADAVSALAACVGDPDEAVEARRTAAHLLGGCGAQADVAVPALVAAMKDRSAHIEIRRAAVHACGVMGAPARDAATVLGEILSDGKESPGMRSAAATSLGLIGNGALSALPALLRGLSDGEVQVRAQSALAIGAIGGSAPEGGPALIQALKDDAPAVREAAVEALGSMEEEAGVVAALLGAMHDTDESVRLVAIKAVAEFSSVPPEAAEAVVALLGDADAAVRATAAESLAEIKPKPLNAVPALIAALGDREPLVKYGAAVALGSFEGDARAAIPALTEAILTRDNRNESQIVEPDLIAALRAVGADMNTVAPSLAEALATGDDDTRGRAERALSAIGAEALPALADALARGDEATRQSAARALESVEFPLGSNIVLTGEQAYYLKAAYEGALEELRQQAYINPTFKARFESAVTWLAPQSTTPTTKAAPVPTKRPAPPALGWALPAGALLLVVVVKTYTGVRKKPRAKE